MKALIVDDERLARRELRALLKPHAEIAVVGEAETVAQALDLIRVQSPDVVFLDIQMPGESGFRLLEQTEAVFKTIFVTAFDAYAIRAFEVNALDYLLKPINPDRLAQALERLNASAAKPAVSARKLEYEDRLFLEIEKRSRFLKVSAIAGLCAAGDYSEVLTDDGNRWLVEKSLKEWEERLPEKYFVRIHRSTIINLEYVERIEDWFHRAYRIFLRACPEPFIVSRRYASKLRENFG